MGTKSAVGYMTRYLCDGIVDVREPITNGQEERADTRPLFLAMAEAHTRG